MNPEPDPILTRLHIHMITFACAATQFLMILSRQPHEQKLGVAAICDYYDLMYNALIIFFILLNLPAAVLYGVFIGTAFAAAPGKFLYGIIEEGIRQRAFNYALIRGVFFEFWNWTFGITVFNVAYFMLTCFKVFHLILMATDHYSYTWGMGIGENLHDDDDDDDEDEDEEENDNDNEIQV